MYIASDHLQYRIFSDSPADLFIEPSIDESQFQAQDVNAALKLYEFGYEYGLSHADEWKKNIEYLLILEFLA